DHQVVGAADCVIPFELPALPGWGPSLVLGELYDGANPDRMRRAVETVPFAPALSGLVSRRISLTPAVPDVGRVALVLEDHAHAEPFLIAQRGRIDVVEYFEVEFFRFHR